MASPETSATMGDSTETATTTNTVATTEAGASVETTDASGWDAIKAAITETREATANSDDGSDAVTVIFVGEESQAQHDEESRVQHDEDSRVEQVPTLVDAIRLFHNIYTFLLAPAFAHPYWLLETPAKGRVFPALVRGVIDMFESLPLNDDDLDPEQLRNWFASFVQMFCEHEMGILGVGPVEKPGEHFHWSKYGVWCDWKWNTTMVSWARHVHTFRNEWSWGVEGGTRGLAGFIEAVGLWAHVFCRMLEKPWTATGLSGEPSVPWVSGHVLFQRACWEMHEYLYKWAVRVQPRVEIVPIVIHPPRDTLSETDEAEYSSSDYGDGASPTTLDQTDLEVEVDEDPWTRPAANEYGVMAPREDNYYDNDAVAQAEDAERAWFSEQMLNLEL